MGRVIKKANVPEANLSQNIDGNEGVNTGKSKEITDRILQLMATRNWNQKELAENMEKSEAEISKLLSGQHNFTLRTIAKFETVLDGDVIVVPSTVRQSIYGGIVVKMNTRAKKAENDNSKFYFDSQELKPKQVVHR